MGNCILSCIKNIKDKFKSDSINIELPSIDESNSKSQKKYLCAQTQTESITYEKIQLVNGDVYI